MCWHAFFLFFRVAIFSGCVLLLSLFPMLYVAHLFGPCCGLAMLCFLLSPDAGTLLYFLVAYEFLSHSLHARS